MPLYMPELYEERATRQMTSVFGGLNRGARIPDGEWADMQNLTSDQYPLMATRAPRFRMDKIEIDENGTVIPSRPYALTVRSYAETEGDGTLHNCEGAVWLDGDLLCFGSGRHVDLSEYGLSHAKEQKLLNFGAYIIVYPAMIYVNTVDMEDLGWIGDIITKESAENTTWAISARPVNYEMCSANMVVKTLPETFTDGELCFYTGNAREKGLYVYSEEGDEEGHHWIKERDYIRIGLSIKKEKIVDRTDPSDETVVKEIYYDVEQLKFRKSLLAGDTLRLKGFEELYEEISDGYHVVQNVFSVTTDSKTVLGFTIEGLLKIEDLTSTQVDVNRDIPTGSSIVIERALPHMDYMCEADNRLWGCHYGEDRNGNFVNEIYCSARGDFFRWIQGAADNDDSPVTFSIGIDGPWTGCVNYGGAPTFFKERCMHRIGGYGASGFYVQDTPVRGVMSGASDSLAVVNGVLYYYADGAAMAYDGSLPVPVSEKLGRLSGYGHAVGGAYGNKYYLSLCDKASSELHVPPTHMILTRPERCDLYVLDTEKGLWHREDDCEICSMAWSSDDLAFVVVGEGTDSENGVSFRRLTYTLCSVRGSDRVGGGAAGWAVEGAAIPWYAVSGIIGLETPDKKYLSKISIRLHLDEGASVRVSVEYDSLGTWKQVLATSAMQMKTLTVPIIPMRCDHMRLRLDGVGGCKVYSIAKTFTEAEDE